MKRILPALLLLAILCHGQKTSAQQNKKEQIAKHLTDYFFLERENIHAHLNKNVFMANEQVWFKGYVFHRKKNLPFFSTVNVYASLIDSEGKIVETQLVYGNIGTFSGNFKLGNHFKSGKYYLQFYTNWMNNFIEDESAVYEIAVINESEGAGTALAKADQSKIKIALKPEGGTLVSGIHNTIGISIADCNNGLLPVTEADITDAAGKTIMKVQINKKGYGKFVLPANAAGYKAVVTVDDIRHEQPLPQPSPGGIALDVNNTSDKTFIKLRTNAATAGALGGKPVFIVVHQDDNTSIYEVAFSNGSTEQSIAIPATELFDGLNTIRILDNDLKQLAERLIYKHPQPGITNVFSPADNTQERLKYKGKVSYPNMSLSLSALPDNTISLSDEHDIYSSFLLKPYIDGHKGASGRYYFANPSKVKTYELDLYLLNQKGKYDWKNITGAPPASKFTFDMGLTLRGTVLKSAGDTRFSKVRLYSLSPKIDEMTTVDDNREFSFDNIIIADSTYVNFTLLRKSEEPKQLVLAPQVLNGNKKFNKPYLPDPKYYRQSSADNNPAIPGFQMDVTELEEVTIESNGLKYASSFGNGKLTGHKISDMQANAYQNLLNFLMSYSTFDIRETNGRVTILNRTRNSINGAQSGPIIFLDNVQMLDYDLLKQIQMYEVDEVYIGAHTIVSSVRNYMGAIRIYLKKGARGIAKNTTPDIVIKNGFRRISPFQNVSYLSRSDKGFENFGVIDWQPSLMTDEQGQYDFALSKTGVKQMKIIIEGFSADGKLISETKVLPAN